MEQRLQDKKIYVGDPGVVSESIINYLGVIIDAKVSFTRHMAYTRKKTAKAILFLVRMLHNNEGPKDSDRFVKAGVVKFILLHSIPFWAGAVDNAVKQSIVSMAYRPIVLRVCSIEYH